MNKDIAVLAKKVYELSALKLEELDARKWEALLVLNAVFSAATKAGIDKANADKFARWGPQIEKEGLLYALHPKWHLRADDGKPPSARFALESALDNPAPRSLRDRAAALMLLSPDELKALGDLVRTLSADAWDGATGDARDQFGAVMRGISKTYTSQPWLIMSPHEGGLPPIFILIDNQGPTQDPGGFYDSDPTDDPLFSWDKAIRTWDIDFLRDNPLAQIYTGLGEATEAVGKGALDVGKGALDATKALATILKWAPFALAGIGVVGVTSVVIAMTNRYRGTPSSAPNNGPRRTDS